MEPDGQDENCQLEQRPVTAHPDALRRGARGLDEQVGVTAILRRQTSILGGKQVVQEGTQVADRTLFRDIGPFGDARGFPRAIDHFAGPFQQAGQVVQVTGQLAHPQHRRSEHVGQVVPVGVGDAGALGALLGLAAQQVARIAIFTEIMRAKACRRYSSSFEKPCA